MEEHSVIGERILRNVEDYAEIAHVVRHHHERVDGMGYPDKLAGDEIPLLSRIVKPWPGLVDVEPMPGEEADEEAEEVAAE